MKMDLRELLLAFTMLWSMSSALRCYNCEPKKDDYRPVELCEHFDYSDKFLIECKGSTMCYKKEVISTLGNGIKLYQRGCARQLMADDQQMINHQWTYVNKIYEPYEEGCIESSKDDKVTTTVNCYCRGELCNAGVVTRSRGIMVAIGSFLFKYLLQ